MTKEYYQYIRPHRSDDRLRRILYFSAESFLSKGYHGSCLEEIAVRAGVSKMTIYKIFYDKPRLASTILDDLSESLNTECLSVIDMQASPEDCLTNIYFTYLNWMSGRIGSAHRFGIFRLLVERWDSYPVFPMTWRDKLAEFIAKCIDNGKIISMFDPDFLAYEFSRSICHEMVAMWGKTPISYDLDLLRSKVKLFLNGCERRQSDHAGVISAPAHP